MIQKIRWVDSHSHSKNSMDGSNSVREMCKRAVEAKLDVYAVTDHCEINGFEAGGFCESIRHSFEETEEQKKRYDGKLDILSGIELGQPMENLEHTEEALRIGAFDFVLGSLHNLPGKPDFYFLEYDHVDLTELLKQYFNDLCEMIVGVAFDSVAHITYPLRYIVGDRKRKVDMGKLQSHLDEALRLTAEKGKALEINTSGLRQNIGTTLPDLSIVKRFRKLGGELITIGSDAHNIEDLGKGIREGYEVARNAGFHSIVYYKKREPVEIPIG